MPEVEGRIKLYSADRRAAIAVNVIQRRVGRIVHEYDPVEPTNLGCQILNMYLDINDPTRLVSFADFARKHEEFKPYPPDFSEIIIAQAAKKLYVDNLMSSQGLSEAQALELMGEFHSKRHSLVAKQTMARKGATYASELARMQKSAWKIESLKKLLALVMDDNYSWKDGKFMGKPNWKKIADVLGVTVKQARDRYFYTRNAIIYGNTDPDLITRIPRSSASG